MDRTKWNLSPAAERIVAALDEEGIKSEPYSGRGMYGKYCVSVRNYDAYDLPRGLGKPSEDSMGKGNVLYCPSALLEVPQ